MLSCQALRIYSPGSPGCRRVQTMTPAGKSSYWVKLMARSNVQRRWYLSHPSRPPALWWQFFGVGGLLLGKEQLPDVWEFKNLGSRKNHTSHYAVSGWAGCPNSHTCTMCWILCMNYTIIQSKKILQKLSVEQWTFHFTPWMKPYWWSQAITLCAFGLCVRKCCLYNYQCCKVLHLKVTWM